MAMESGIVDGFELFLVAKGSGNLEEVVGGSALKAVETLMLLTTSNPDLLKSTPRLGRLRMLQWVDPG